MVGENFRTVVLFVCRWLVSVWDSERWKIKVWSTANQATVLWIMYPCICQIPAGNTLIQITHSTGRKGSFVREALMSSRNKTVVKLCALHKTKSLLKFYLRKVVLTSLQIEHKIQARVKSVFGCIRISHFQKAFLFSYKHQEKESKGEPAQSHNGATNFDTIKKPMNLSITKEKLESNQYNDTWRYAKDDRHMFRIFCAMLECQIFSCKAGSF